MGLASRHLRSIDINAAPGIVSSWFGMPPVNDQNGFDGGGQSQLNIYGPARHVPAFWRAINLIGDLIGGLDFDAYNKQPDDYAELVSPRPPLLDNLFPEETMIETLHSAVWDYYANGNVIFLIARRDADGTPTAVVPIPASWCGVRRQTQRNTMIAVGQLVYSIGGQQYSADDIIHIKGPHAPGALRGCGVLEAHFRTMRRSIELDEAANDVGNNGVPTGVLTLGNPDAKAADGAMAKAAWLNDEGTTIRVVGPNDKFTPLSWNPEERQLIEARQYSLLEIANIVGIAPRYVGASSGDSMTYTSSEAESAELTKLTLRGFLLRFEQKISQYLPATMTVRANLDELLRADTLTRFQAYHLAIDDGWLLRSEARKAERLKPVAGIDQQVLPVKAQAIYNAGMPAGGSVKGVTPPPGTDPSIPPPPTWQQEDPSAVAESRAHSGLDDKFGKGSHLWEYWKHWLTLHLTDPHPWEALRDALLLHAVKGGLPPSSVPGLATNIFVAVTGHGPTAHDKAGELLMGVAKKGSK